MNNLDKYFMNSFNKSVNEIIYLQRAGDVVNNPKKYLKKVSKEMKRQEKLKKLRESENKDNE